MEPEISSEEEQGGAGIFELLPGWAKRQVEIRDRDRDFWLFLFGNTKTSCKWSSKERIYCIQLTSFSLAQPE